MSEQRIKGQETIIEVTKDNEVVDAITDVRSMEVAGVMEILSEGYLGETSDRRDEIFKGVRGRIEMHLEKSATLDFMMDIINRATRRDPSVKVNFKTTLQFPSGERRRILIRNIFFGEMPLGFGGRAEYGTFGIDFESGDRPVLI